MDLALADGVGDPPEFIATSSPPLTGLHQRVRHHPRMMFKAFSDQTKWLEGLATAIGKCTSGVKDAYMMVSRIAASRACTPVSIARPAAIWAMPVA